MEKSPPKIAHNRQSSFKVVGVALMVHRALAGQFWGVPDEVWGTRRGQSGRE
jgi:hypothetical protein